MSEAAETVAEPASREATAMSVVRWLVIGVAAVAAAVFLVRLPTVIADFDKRATSNAAQSPIGRAIQGSDALEIPNDFLVQALSLVPPSATYVVELPQSLEIAQKYNMSPTTYIALRDYVRFVFLPRREAPPDRAEYLICYACDTDPFDVRMKRLWTDPHGIVIGKLER
jgi:hypothetical protein